MEVTSDSQHSGLSGKARMEKLSAKCCELDQVKRTGTVNGVWSRIEYQNADGTEKVRDISRPAALDVARCSGTVQMTSSIHR